MFGSILKPKVLLNMLGSMGFKLEEALPQIESFILEKCAKIEAETGCPVCLIAMKNKESESVDIFLYKMLENDELEHYKQFKLTDLMTEFKNIAEDDTTKIEITDSATVAE